MKHSRLRGLLTVLLLALPCAALTLTPAPAEAPAQTPSPAAEAVVTPRPARGDVLVQTGTQSGWLPLPDAEEDSYTFPLIQQTADGGFVQNHIHVTPEGVSMAFSTCENQDCVEQGEVTLENRETRPLMNYIICLPNQVTLALYTPEEVLALFGQD